LRTPPPNSVSEIPSSFIVLYRKCALTTAMPRTIYITSSQHQDCRKLVESLDI
jgi:hypothetical protein